MTGLTDKMRADFKVMKDIAEYTRISPNQRQLALRKFIRSVKGMSFASLSSCLIMLYWLSLLICPLFAVTENPNASKTFSDWGLTLEDTTVSFEARVVPTEQIIFGGTKTTDAGPQADWSRAATNNPCLTTVCYSYFTFSSLFSLHVLPKRHFVRLTVYHLSFFLGGSQ